MYHEVQSPIEYSL